MAIGIVLANPERNKDHPRVLRRSALNRSAKSKPAPNPIAPRVAAMIAIWGILRFLVFEVFTALLLSVTWPRLVSQLSIVDFQLAASGDEQVANRQ